MSALSEAELVYLLDEARSRPGRYGREDAPQVVRMRPAPQLFSEEDMNGSAR